MSSYERHWGLHGFTINSYKEKLEEVLGLLPADAPSRGHIGRVIGTCRDFLTVKELRGGGDLIDKKSEDVVEKWMRGLLSNHPELAEYGVRV